jgi:Tol biopolymer transport system component
MAADTEILESWKEIAAYLKRDVTTVQRWEKREGLPVHRHLHDKSGSVFARRGELDAWRRARTRAPDAPSEPADTERERTAAPDRGALGRADENGAGHPPVAIVPPAPTAESTRRALLFGLALVAVIVTLGSLRPDTRLATPEPIAFSVEPPDGLALVPNEPPLIAPDGRAVVFVAVAESGISRLVIREIDTVTPRVLPGTEGARYPFWSADSRQVAFFADRHLRAVAVGGGEPRAITEAPYGQAGTWDADGVILFPLSAQSGLYRVQMQGGTPVQVTTPEIARGDYAHRVPHYLPDGRRFIFLVKSTRPDREGIYVGSLDGAEPKQLMRALSEARYASGRLLFVTPPALMAVGLNTSSMKVEGSPVVLARDTSHESFTARGLFSVSDNGVIAYSTMRMPAMRLVQIDRDGETRELGVAPGTYWDLAPAPRGTTVALTEMNARTATRDILLVSLDTGARRQITTDPVDDAMPVWSPDGGRLAFSSRRLGSYDIFVTDLAGGAARPLLTGEGDQWVGDWSPDGRFLVYSSNAPGNATRSDLYTFDLESKKSTVLVATRGRDTHARFSPDGRWVAYSCDATGQPEVYLQRFPAQGHEHYLVSLRGGGYPRWRADGRELYYVDPTGTVMAASLELGESPVVGNIAAAARGALARLGPTISGLGADYAPIDLDGRFLVKQPAEPVAGPITVVVNGLNARHAP